MTHVARYHADLRSENISFRNLWLKHSVVNGMCKIWYILFCDSYIVSRVKNDMILNLLRALRSLTSLISEELSPIISAITNVSFC